MPDPSLDSSPRVLMRHLRNDPSEYSRGCAAQVLGQMKEKRALSPLLQALSDSSSWVRGWSAYALGQLQEPSTLSTLCGTLGDKDSWVRQQAAAALETVGDSHQDDTSNYTRAPPNTRPCRWPLRAIPFPAE